MQLVKENDSAPSLRAIKASLERLERREWWRLAAALLITLFLTFGVFALSLPDVKKDAVSRYQLDMAVPGLFGLVLVFDVFAIYQQVRISRLRRQLAGQIGMLAALEVLKPVAPEEQVGWKERRRASRHPFDQRLMVKATVDGQEATFYGRVIDVNEFGLGAVISGSLQRGDRVLLEFSAVAGNMPLLLTAVVRYTRGFRHGFEFSGLGTVELETLRSCSAEVSALVH